ncbi:glutamate--tRNA ligase [Croceivirga thetidis]|uniref:Glutamate--tRNA ligase n=1 Tax=Croceivirga thetidis TaxID=2721623 RepID=A0ABX1GMX4_9FLAO|nr:glutamate--tRNA ligase [Croceivirga thetidis]NKI31224.1 glutamate--tRNA ligase [Croceivirga thetidis]
MAPEIRVRFAPSPTGPLHIGGLRTALFNYLFAKNHNGKFIVRIEDTDQNRFVKGAEDYILDSLKWCGLTVDEGPKIGGPYGPYRQSERKHLYQDYAKQLIKTGHAYYAFDTPQELNDHRKNHEQKGKTFIYNWHNRLKLKNSLALSSEVVKQKIDANEPYVIRFKCPENQTLLLEDIIRGEIKIDSSTLDDKVLFKNDGMPTYHLANIVDDHLMKISHVIRGEEWLPSLALHNLLYEAFNWEKPKFAHLPLILKPIGKGKLSKRDGEKGGFPIFPLSWNESIGYKESGFFPEAVVNFLALLGWNPGTEQELFTLSELGNSFSLDRVNKSGARFDPEKNNWFNQQWLQQMDNTTLLPHYKQLLESNGVNTTEHSDDALIRIISLIKERASFVSDFWELSNYFFVAPITYNEKASKKQWKENTPELMSSLSQELETVQQFSSANIESTTKSWIEEKGHSFGKVIAPFRLALVGDLKGPHLFDIASLIGKEETLNRLTTAINKL